MAERKQVEETKRMDEAFVLSIFLDFGGDGSEVAGHVGVGEHDSFGLGGGAGGEDNFERIGWLDRTWPKAIRRMLRDGAEEIDRVNGGKSFKMHGALARTQREPGANLLADAPREIRIGSVIDGDGENSREGASEESSDPFGAVRAPQKDGIASHDIAGGQFAGKLMSGSSDLRIGPAFMTIAAWIDVGRRRAPALKIVEVVQ